MRFFSLPFILSHLPLLLCVALPTSLSAQTTRTNLKGTVVDSAQAPLAGVSVVLLKAADSVLVSFGLTNEEGRFHLRRVPAGDYLLQMSVLNYARYSESVVLDGIKEEQDLGLIRMQTPVYSLGETVIEAERTPIFINGDTIEYNADAFKTQANAVVEDLLKKLPGVQVDRDGSIKAQGETVRKVLVDGKEFFGDDPQMATKNLPADAVDRVQVFDKKSEVAEFTGIDDGQRDKTINLELKEEKKQGVFGSVKGGYGTENRYAGKANVNRFNNRLQFSSLGMLNNVNEAGFSFGDYISFLGGMQNMMSGGGGSMRISIEDDGSTPIDLGGNNQGFIRTGLGGVNFNYDLSKKSQLFTNYLYSNIRTRKDRELYRENFLGDQTYITESAQEQLTEYGQHRFNLTLRQDLDSLSKLTFKAQAGYREGLNDNLNTTANLNAERVLENDGLSDYHSEADRLDLNTELFYLRRFRKKGRAFTAQANFGRQTDDISLNLYSVNSFFGGGDNPFRSDTITQNQFQDLNQISYGGRVTFTEPLGRGKYIEANYRHSNYGETSRRDVFDRALSPGFEDIFNPFLSNHFRKDYLYDRGGLNFRRNKKSSQFNLGVAYQQSRLNGEIFSQDTTITKTFRNFLPSLYYNYEIATAKSVSFQYDTEIREPSLEELQPLVNNTDPLNIYLGNPDLEAEYRHRANLHLMIYDQFNFIHFFADLSATYTLNKITYARSIDSLFRQTTQPINVGQDIRVQSFLNYGMPIRPLKMKFNVETRSTYNRGITFVNNIENTTDRWNHVFQLVLENRRKDIVDLQVGGELGLNRNTYSVNQELDQAFVSQRYFVDVYLTLGKSKKWTLDSNFDYMVYPGDQFGSAQTIALWKASVGRSFLKNDRAELRLIGFDLLNQNQGFNRINELNFLQEERVNSLGRYVMLQFTWRLSVFGAPGPSIDFRHR
jgi:hypothetical protein